MFVWFVCLLICLRACWVFWVCVVAWFVVCCLNKLFGRVVCLVCLFGLIGVLFTDCCCLLIIWFWVSCFVFGFIVVVFVVLFF